MVTSEPFYFMKISLKKWALPKVVEAAKELSNNHLGYKKMTD